MTGLEVLIISTFWLFIILCWKSYKDKVIKYHKHRIIYLEDRLRRNNVHYETETSD